MDSVTSDRFWFWFGLLVILDLVVNIIVRALAASSFSVRTYRDHHNIYIFLQIFIYQAYFSPSSKRTDSVNTHYDRRGVDVVSMRASTGAEQVKSSVC